MSRLKCCMAATRIPSNFIYHQACTHTHTHIAVCVFVCNMEYQYLSICYILRLMFFLSFIFRLSVIINIQQHPRPPLVIYNLKHTEPRTHSYILLPIHIKAHTHTHTHMDTYTHTVYISDYRVRYKHIVYMYNTLTL